MGGPIWLLQLWLLATFETKLNLIIPDMIMPSLENRRTEGIRLAQMRNQEINIPVEDAFSSHYEMFLKCHTFTPSMAPFINRTHGPAWFTREFPTASLEFAEETNQTWQAYLSPSLLSTRLTTSKTKTSFGVSRYFPSCLARQFGLCQLRPAPAVHHRGEFLCPTTEPAYRRLFEKFRYRNLIFEPISFNPKFACTKEFHDWWLEYYHTVSKGSSENDFLAKLLNAHLPSKEKKTRATPTKNVKRKKSTQMAPEKSIVKEKKKKAGSKSTLTPFMKEIAELAEAEKEKAKKQAKPPSPIAMIKPARNEIISSSSEETDDDDIPLRQRSILARKRTQPGTQRVSKGIVINEPQNQPPPKKTKIQPTSTQTKGKEIALAETTVETTPQSLAPGQTILEAASIEISDEPQIELNPQEFMVSTVPSITSTQNLAAEPATENVEQAVSAQSVEKESTAEADVEMREEEPKETFAPNNAADIIMADKGEDAATESTAQEDNSVRDSTSSAVSNEELSKLKKENPLAAFKLMLSLSSSSPKIAGSSSTTSLTSINQDATERPLQQLKAKILEGNLLARIEENPVESFEIKSLTQKLQQADPNQELLAFLIEFVPLFDQLSTNISKRASTQKHKEQVNKLYQEKCQALETAQANISAMEAQATKDEKEIAEWDAKIQHYKEEIANLQTKLNDAEHQKGLVEKRMETSTSSKLQDEALVAIQHLDSINEHQVTISQIDKNLGQLETSITLSASILDRLKASLAKL